MCARARLCLELDPSLHAMNSLPYSREQYKYALLYGYGFKLGLATLVTSPGLHSNGQYGFTARPGLAWRQSCTVVYL